MRIEPHIDRVVLEGIADAGDAREIRQALTAPATSLLAPGPSHLLAPTVPGAPA